MFGFQYTGQIWLAELGMYHYKARIYSPTLGRFLQTDPVGYEDQMNLYAYVGNDPVNAVDPTGMELDCTRAGEGATCIDSQTNHTYYNDTVSDYDFHRLDRLAEPSEIANNVDRAVDKSSTSQKVTGQAGRNVDQDSRYVATHKGYIDLQHATSAGVSPMAGTGIPNLMGGAMEVYQLLTGQDSAFKEEDMISNYIGDAAANSSAMNRYFGGDQGSIGRNIKQILDSSVGYKPLTGAEALRYKGFRRY